MRNSVVWGFALMAAMASTAAAQTSSIQCTGPLAPSDVVGLLSRDVAPRRVVAYVEKCGVTFDLTPEIQAMLKAAKADETVLKAVGAAAARRVAEEAAAGKKQADLQVAQRRALEDAAWLKVKDADDPARLTEFLQLWVDGAHADEARRRIELLKPKPGAPVADRWGLRWAPIPAGLFEMGCTPNDADCARDEMPAHVVTLTRPFWLTTTEVAVGHYGAVGLTVPVQPAWNADTSHPVVSVTWDEAINFCQAVGGRLPTEAEWERAARGGQTGLRYPSGLRLGHDDGNFVGIGGRDQWERSPAPVGSFAPNALGLFEMAGNVWEWVADGYSPTAYSDRPVTDPSEPLSASALRVVRGGSWNDSAKYLRVSTRYRFAPSTRESAVGFRCARDSAPSR